MHGKYDSEYAKERGTRIHKLLEILPHKNYTLQDEESCLANKTIENFPEIFGENSYAEVSFIDDNIKGQIDRIVFENNLIKVIDMINLFKTLP